jgi:hypothetical protein
MKASMNNTQENRRAFERYNVAHLKGLTGSITSVSLYSYLVSMAAGGCGFYSARKLKSPEPIVVCKFEWPDVFLDPIVVEGKILYSVPKELDDVTLFFTGIQFLEDQRFMTQLLIKQLEQMAEHGLVEKFLR